MLSFLYWLYDSFNEFIAQLSNHSVNFIDNTFYNFGYDIERLGQLDVNLVLFSETPILSINMFDLLLLFFSLFYAIIFITIVYKIIKKVLVKITGWKKW